jgi:hypothetical protein
MKTMRSVFLILLIAFFVCNNNWGQKIIQKDVVVTLYGEGISYGPDIINVAGTYTYHFSLHLNKEGKIECIHWNSKNYDLHTEDGDWVKIIDSGHDNSGFVWDFWNNKDVYNEGFNIYYDVSDGWLDEYMPAPDDMPVEGAFINMSCKILCKGKIVDWSYMVVLHINANGDITVDMVKP